MAHANPGFSKDAKAVGAVQRAAANHEQILKLLENQTAILENQRRELLRQSGLIDKLFTMSQSLNRRLIDMESKQGSQS